eukprot:34569-Alexandrium_andersonii.AAC.1
MKVSRNSSWRLWRRTPWARLRARTGVADQLLGIVKGDAGARYRHVEGADEGANDALEGKAGQLE